LNQSGKSRVDLGVLLFISGTELMQQRLDNALQYAMGDFSPMVKLAVARRTILIAP
jgi:hypothetical protein